ncbi:MAG: thioredoxin-dependent thiol peroxidase [Micrococcales bacterium]|nr:thioredoxin-dependent thiol peroxidase [Micrococcales bacterium]
MTRLVPGDTAPTFSLPSDEGKQLSLSDFSGSRLLLYVYPAAMTPGCTAEACDFRDSLNTLQTAGFEVVGLSPDHPKKLAEFRKLEGLNFPLLSDPSKGVLTAYGAFGEKKLYGKVVVGVIRSTFVIGPTGLIDNAWYNVRAKGHVAKLQRDLDI